MKKILMILISTMLLLALGSESALAALVYQSNNEPYLWSVVEDKYGAGNYQNITNSAGCTFKGVYDVTALIVTHAAANTDPTGWYDNDEEQVIFNTPGSELNTPKPIPTTSTFGLFIDSYSGGQHIGKFYTETSKNADNTNHIKIYKIKNQPNTYVVGFEDLTGTSSDLDYNDIIVEVRGVTTSVPEFPTVAIPVAAVLGLVFIIGRKKERL